MNHILTPANAVTFFRIALLVFFAFVVQTASPWIRYLSLILIPLLFYLDSLDGYLARSLKCATRLGAVLDVAGDRIVEIVLWMLLAYLEMIPLWIVVIVIVRGFVTDGFRSLAIADGHGTFTMMQSRLGRWLVASPASRTSYAILKGILFTFGFGIWGFLLQGHEIAMIIFYGLVVLTLVFNLLRGFFSILECSQTA